MHFNEYLLPCYVWIKTNADKLAQSAGVVEYTDCISTEG